IALQAKALQGDARLAAAYAARLSHRHTHLVVSQNLLPHLWLSGALQGRSFEVLMERLPLAVLQARLDTAAAHHPESPTLADFRAPEAIVAAESAALAAADRLLTPHAEIAALAPGRTHLLDWSPARPLPAAKGGRTLLFPASALGRKGAYALREALYGLPIELAVKGRARESLGFWGNMPVRLLAPGEMPATLAGVVLPAVVEHQPRLLLAALAAGLPVIATPACGLSARPGLTLVPEDDPAALRQAIEALLG
ncbi:glycosyltransferase, partial [Labrys neptuniae]|uniref:glycosyltransferase n=1 Tax=Labrys neptuniae TaxID=376174 RepID=UPI002891FD63